MSRLSDVLFSMFQRGNGKTTAICEAADINGAILIVRDGREAKRVKKEYKVETFPISDELADRLRGRIQPILFDTDVVANIIRIKEDLEKENEQLKESISFVLSAYNSNCSHCGCNLPQAVFELMKEIENKKGN